VSSAKLLFLFTAYLYRGKARDEKGNLIGSINDYTNAISMQTDYAIAYFLRANTYHKKGDFQKAIQDYTEAIYISPNDANLYWNRGFAYRQLAEPIKAEQDFDYAHCLNQSEKIKILAIVKI